MLATPTDIELVDCTAQTYARTDPFAENLDNAVRVFLTTLPTGVSVVSFEGTKNLPGWMLDFFAIGTADPIAKLFLEIETGLHPTITHPQLGLLHAGFDAGAMSVMPHIALAMMGKPFAITGHSLGAALALRVCAEFILDGTPPLKCAAFAPPRVGGDKFVKIATSVPSSAYRFGNDPVPDVPLTLPGYPYMQVPLSEVGSPMPNPFDAHAIENYVAAVHGAQR